MQDTTRPKQNSLFCDSWILVMKQLVFSKNKNKNKNNHKKLNLFEYNPTYCKFNKTDMVPVNVFNIFYNTLFDRQLG